MSSQQTNAPAGAEAAFSSPENLSPADAATQIPAKGCPRWTDQSQGRLISIDWAQWLDCDKHIDPYLVWADVSRFAGFGGWGPEETEDRSALHNGLWPLLIELDEKCPLVLPPLPKGSVLPVADIFASMRIPGVYLIPNRDTVPTRQLKSRFITARIAPNSVQQLLTSGHVRRMQLGVPRLGVPDVTRPNVRNETAGLVPRTVIGIIDDGCAFAHPAFCDSQGATRVHFLWDQDPRRLAAGRWKSVSNVDYGAELRQPELVQASMAAAKAAREAAAYEQVDYGPVHVDASMHGTTFQSPAGVLPGTAMRRSAHGTGTMYLAAGVERELGHAPPLRVQRSTEQTSRDPPGADFATRWPIIFVQLPTRTLYDTSGGSLGVHVLDGIRYIIHRARSLPYGERPRGNAPDSASELEKDTGLLPDHDSNKIIVNVSYGAVAGPHDGTSILEQAMADIVRADGKGESHTWICLAAGNAHRQRTHARLTIATGQSGSFSWHIGADNPQESYLEVWLPEVDTKQVALPAGFVRSIEITVTPPGGYPPRRIRCGQLWLCEVDGRQRSAVVAGMIFARTVAQGLSGTMVLLAVRSTRPDDGGSGIPLPPHGEWLVEVSSVNDWSDPSVKPGRAFVVHAWAERNDLLFGNLRAQQGTVVSADPVPEPTEFSREAQVYFGARSGGRSTRHLVDQMQPRLSLGSAASVAEVEPGDFYKYGEGFGTGHVTVVGGYRIADGEVADYSAGGPSRHAHEQNPTQEPDSEMLRRWGHAPTASAPRIRPDAIAPSDVSPALRGVRVPGTRAGSLARLAGTSAAAPSVVRAIANFQHAVSWDDKGQPSEPSELAWLRGRFGIGVEPVPVADAPLDPARPTPTPRKDDLYRRGRWRIR